MPISITQYDYINMAHSGSLKPLNNIFNVGDKIRLQRAHIKHYAQIPLIVERKVVLVVTRCEGNFIGIRPFPPGFSEWSWSGNHFEVIKNLTDPSLSKEEVSYLVREILSDNK